MRRPTFDADASEPRSRFLLRGESLAISMSTFLLGVCLCAYGDAPGPIRKDARWVTLKGGLVNDTKTTLQWTTADNGADIDWKGAMSHCAEKQSGWRLPTPEELRSLYIGPEAHIEGVPCGQAICHIAPNFKLTGAWFWSSMPVGEDAYDGVELAWGVLLANGARTQSVKEASFGSRALCVRKQ